MDWLIALITLSAMEIVLGIDNIIFIAILSGRLPEHQRAKARSLGLVAALATRVLLLLSLKVVLGLTQPVFHLTDLGIPPAWVEAAEEGTIFTDQEPTSETEQLQTPAAAAGHGAGSEADVHDVNAVSWRDLILLAGGLFLIGKSVLEIHHKLEGAGQHEHKPQAASFASVLIQIALLDIIFSLDSVITAVGMAKQLWVMITAVIIAVAIMLIFAGAISAFVEKHPTIKVLALSFLILIGVLLVAEGFGTPVNKGYIYFAMAFSLVVELLNMRVRHGQGVNPSFVEPPEAEPTA